MPPQQPKQFKILNFEPIKVLDFDSPPPSELAGLADALSEGPKVGGSGYAGDSGITTGQLSQRLRNVENFAPTAASVAAVPFTGGMSIPAQMGIQGGIAGVGAGLNQYAEGGTSRDALNSALLNGAFGGIATGVGALMTKGGLALLNRMKPTVVSRGSPSAQIRTEEWIGGKPLNAGESIVTPPTAPQPTAIKTDEWIGNKALDAGERVITPARPTAIATDQPSAILDQHGRPFTSASPLEFLKPAPKGGPGSGVKEVEFLTPTPRAPKTGRASGVKLVEYIEPEVPATMKPATLSPERIGTIGKAVGGALGGTIGGVAGSSLGGWGAMAGTGIGGALGRELGGATAQTAIPAAARAATALGPAIPPGIAALLAALQASQR